MTQFTLTVLNAEDGVISVRIPEENAPMAWEPKGVGPDGEVFGDFVRDHGNADWPSDVEIAEVASKALGRNVAVSFVDAGDDLLEGIYAAEVA